MIEFGKAAQQSEVRRDRLLMEATFRRMKMIQPLPARQLRLPHRLALTLGDWLIQLGTRLKAPYQPVKFPILSKEQSWTKKHATH